MWMTSRQDVGENGIDRRFGKNQGEGKEMQEPSFDRQQSQHTIVDHGYDPAVSSDSNQQAEDFAVVEEQEEEENEQARDQEEEVQRARARRNGRMLLGLVLGVFSLILWWLPIIGCVIAATGLVISIRRFHEITARKTAYAGVILSGVGLLLGLLFTGGIIFSIVVHAR
jgi:hypothetical protein